MIYTQQNPTTGSERRGYDSSNPERLLLLSRIDEVHRAARGVVSLVKSAPSNESSVRINDIQAESRAAAHGLVNLVNSTPANESAVKVDEELAKRQPRFNIITGGVENEPNDAALMPSGDVDVNTPETAPTPAHEAEQREKEGRLTEARMAAEEARTAIDNLARAA